MTAPPDLSELLSRLKAWLLGEALPLWWARGADLAQGGFVDRLNLDGTPAKGYPKRVRVQARQAYVYGLADARGWMVGADRAARHALWGLESMRRADGLYRAAPAPGAHPLPDGMGELYDQAFALLALDSGRHALGESRFEHAADELRERLADFAHPLGGFAESPGLEAPLFANPNMHLFESFQAWSEVSPDPVWRGLAEGQARLGLERLIDPASGVLFERYDADWRAPERAEDRLVWPGHLYEWAYLLLRWKDGGEVERLAALRLIEAAERTGVFRDRGVVILALDGALQPLDRGARLWAQTERMRAAALAASVANEEALWTAALQAAQALELFLQTPTPGLWRDFLDESGVFRDEPAPASSLYHIVGAIAELERLLAG